MSEFRFFDSRQKYLLFVTTTNEKSKIANKINPIVKTLKPQKPALKIFVSSMTWRPKLTGCKLSKKKTSSLFQKIQKGKREHEAEVNLRTRAGITDGDGWTRRRRSHGTLWAASGPWDQGTHESITENTKVC